MKRTELRCHASEAGTGLVEVLVAIFVSGIGLLALLTLFPLGALDMADAIQDDRTGAVAGEVVALGDAGEELIARTMDFAEASLAAGSADPQTAARLCEGYADLVRRIEAIEVQLLDLESALPPEQIQRYISRLLALSRSIGMRIAAIHRLLSLLVGDPNEHVSSLVPDSVRPIRV